MYSKDISRYINKLEHGTASALGKERVSLSQHDIVRAIIGNYVDEEDLNRRPLSNLTKDIFNKYG